MAIDSQFAAEEETQERVNLRKSQSVSVNDR